MKDIYIVPAIHAIVVACSVQQKKSTTKQTNKQTNKQTHKSKYHLAKSSSKCSVDGNLHHVKSV